MAIFSNRATLSYNGSTTDSNIAYGEILEVLNVNKTAVDTGYGTGDVLTYVVSLRNTGDTALTGITITDDLGGYVFGGGTVYPLTYEPGSVRLFANGVPQAAPAVTAGPPMTITGVTVPAGGDTVVVYQARANDFANVGAAGTITNTATITGGGLATPITASATLAADTTPNLAISKSISPSQVVDNDRVTNTFILQNYGNTAVDAAENAVITDTFDPILTDLAVTYNGTPWVAGVNYTYNQATGQFATLPGQIAIPGAAITQDPTTGAYTTVPGTGTLVVTGTI